MANQIVQVNVSQIVAPTPSTRQKTGAMISQGATTLTTGTYSLLTEASDLTALLVAGKAITNIAWSSGTVTVTVSGGHGIPTGSANVVIAGVSPTGYNGTYSATVTSSTQLTYPLASNPGTFTALGTVMLAAIVSAQTELTQMVTTFFAQGTRVGVYVLELGNNTAATNIAALQAWITATPKFFYSYLVPRAWTADATYEPFVRLYNSNTSQTYFYTTVTLTNYTSFSTLDKPVIAVIESPTATANEFQAAVPFYTTLAYDPSSSNKVPPLCFSYAYGVTPYTMTNTLATTLKAANVNYITTGAEGGISNAMLVWGHTMDGRPVNYWYSADWSQIHLDQDLSNTIINGSNTNINPLYYDQQGINRLQTSAVKTMSNAIAYGMALGQIKQVQLDPTVFAQNVSAGLYAGMVVVNAVPFATYTSQNPSDYSIGKYSGLACVYTPSRGFESIIFNLSLSDIVAA